MNPLVTVLMTSYQDSLACLTRSIDSILNQTLSDLEFIVIFESGDANYGTLKDHYSDPRLLLIQNDGRLGRSASYNKGLDMARGKYLARMDGDDSAAPERLERQIAFLQAHPDVALVGTAVTLCDEAGGVVGFRQFPEGHTEIVRSMAFTTPICHPAVLWDMDKVGRDLRFDLRFAKYCDDLELWIRLVSRGHKLANLAERLVTYRQPPGYTRPAENWQFSFRVRCVHWRMVLREPRYLIGLLAVGVLGSLPQGLLDRVVGRNRFSDRMRSIAT